jgi:LmbE family N-acetylglucosaminyl deacetylase
LRYRNIVTDPIRQFAKNLRCVWRRWFIPFRLPTREVPSDSVLIIAPHPDDETFGCGHLIALKREQGTPVTVVFVTDGEASLREHGHPEPREVARVRRRQAGEACRCLGLGPDDLRWLSLSDGGVPRRGSPGFDEALERLIAVVEDFNPGYILCSHPLDGHGDHQAAAELAQEASAYRKQPTRLVYYAVWLWFKATRATLKQVDLSTAWQLSGEKVHAKKLEAIAVYLSTGDSFRGIPYCGLLHRSIIYCACRKREIFFEAA